MAGMYEYESQLSDLSNRYAQKSATDDYARMLGQQRFKRQKADTQKGWMDAFPKFTGAWAGRLGHNVQSGVMRQDLTTSVNNFNQGMNRLEADEAVAQGQHEVTKTMDQSQYQLALTKLQEELARQRAMQNPYGAAPGVPAPFVPVGP